MADKKTISVSVRLPVDIVKWVDDETERRNAAMPGARFSRADTVRMLLVEKQKEGSASSRGR